jgi:hypothetical protein
MNVGEPPVNRTQSSNKLFSEDFPSGANNFRLRQGIVEPAHWEKHEQSIQNRESLSIKVEKFVAVSIPSPTHFTLICSDLPGLLSR